MMWRVVVSTVGVAVPVTVTILDVFGYVAKVEGASMQPALNPHDRYKDVDYVLLNRWKARDFSFKRGEVVSLASPSNPDQKIIKRIIALEGDVIRTLSYKNRYLKIPEGHCWVEGDHHGQSLDSNYFGPVALGLINAKASHIVWPPHRWQRLQVCVPPDRHHPRSSKLSDTDSKEDHIYIHGSEETDVEKALDRTYKLTIHDRDCVKNKTACTCKS